MSTSEATDNGGLIEYRILVKSPDLDKGAWLELASQKGRNPREAIRKCLSGATEEIEGASYVAIPVRNWNEETVTVKTEPVVAFA